MSPPAEVPVIPVNNFGYDDGYHAIAYFQGTSKSLQHLKSSDPLFFKFVFTPPMEPKICLKNFFEEKDLEK